MQAAAPKIPLEFVPKLDSSRPIFNKVEKKDQNAG